MFAFVGASVAEGTYQRTKDDKTIVWNDAPKPGESAAWDGGRDEDGYASGFGTLTWYTAKSAVYGRYFGNMVRGKLDGPVNVHSKGKTAHAIFVAGKRSSRWTSGRAPSAQAMAKRLEAARQRVAKTEKVNAEPAKAGTLTEGTVQHAESPAPNPPLPTTGSAKVEEASTNVTARQEVSETGREKQITESTPAASVAGVQQPVAETPAEGPIVAKEEKENAPPPMETQADDAQHPTGEAPVAKGLVGYKEAAEAKEPIGKAEKENVPATTPNAQNAMADESGENEVDDSVRAMMQPPSSLRASSDAAASTSETGARLTKEDAIGAADTAARAAGYDLNNYERPKPEYNGAAGTWSLVYDRKITDETEHGEPFSVAVDDKTKKASIVTGL